MLPWTKGISLIWFRIITIHDLFSSFFLNAILNRQKTKLPGPDTTPTEIRAFSTACFLPKNSILADICDAVFPDGEKGELFA